MKRHIPVALLAIASSASVQAQQSSVTIYGVVDAAVEVVSNVTPAATPTAAGSRLVRMPTLTGSLPSRLGFRGSEDLGGGLRGIFALEMGFAPDSGSLQQGGRAFGRQSYVGLSGPWGQVSLGRQQNMTFHAMVGADVLGPELYGLPSLDAYIANTRSDNSILYLGKFSGLTVGATFSLGRDVGTAGGAAATNCPGESATDSSACRQTTAMIKYDGANWGMAAAYDRMNGGAGAASGLTASRLHDTRRIASGYYKFGDLKLGAGIYRRTNDGAPALPRSDLMFLGASYPVAPKITVDAAIAKLDIKNSANDATMISAKATYAFSRRSAVYLLAGHISNGGTSRIALSPSAGDTLPPLGGSQNGLAVGIRHVF